MRFSANLGFLWTELPLPEAIRAAQAAGFDAVECHWPYATPASEVRTALEETGLEMLGLNTAPGDRAAGEFGLSALPGRGPEARAAIDQALDYAAASGTRAVHVMAGKASGPAAHRIFVENLRHASARAEALGLGLLIEPLNPHDAPGYFLRDTPQALAILAKVGAPHLRLMFDCYHVARTEDAVCERLAACAPHLGHVQIASVPDRGAPDHGTLDYAQVYDTLRRIGWTRPLGAEYRPESRTEDSLAWLATARA